MRLREQYGRSKVCYESSKRLLQHHRLMMRLRQVMQRRTRNDEFMNEIRAVRDVPTAEGNRISLLIISGV